MQAHLEYLFTSARLGFRSWTDDDLADLVELNADERVMEHFPATLSIAESKALLERLQSHEVQYGYTYYAVELKEIQEFIGFIGLAYQIYESQYTPATDIGWRLKPSAWGKGYATEGAKRCLDYAFDELKLDEVISICVASNLNSERVMQKIGMKSQGDFLHPKLDDYPEYQRCLCYSLLR